MSYVESAQAAEARPPTHPRLDAHFLVDHLARFGRIAHNGHPVSEFLHAQFQAVPALPLALDPKLNPFAMHTLSPDWEQALSNYPGWRARRFDAPLAQWRWRQGQASDLGTAEHDILAQRTTRPRA